MRKRLNCLGVKKVEKGSGRRGSKSAKCPPRQAFSAFYFKLPKLPLANPNRAELAALNLNQTAGNWKMGLTSHGYGVDVYCDRAP